jgi:hypothetical protein
MSYARWLLLKLASLYGLMPRPAKRKPPPISLGQGAPRYFS